MILQTSVSNRNGSLQPKYGMLATRGTGRNSKASSMDTPLSCPPSVQLPLLSSVTPRWSPTAQIILSLPYIGFFFPKLGWHFSCEDDGNASFRNVRHYLTGHTVSHHRRQWSEVKRSENWWFTKCLTFPFVVVFVVAGCIIYVLAVYMVVFLYCVCV
jgi:hypothetical protein